MKTKFYVVGASAVRCYEGLAGQEQRPHGSRWSARFLEAHFEQVRLAARALIG